MNIIDLGEWKNIEVRVDGLYVSQNRSYFKKVCELEKLVWQKDLLRNDRYRQLAEDWVDQITKNYPSEADTIDP